MLSAAARVRTSAEHRLVARRGRRATDGPLALSLLVASAADAPVGGRPRAGVVVGKAVGHAVSRNRVRRQLRHLLAARLGDLPPGSALVVRVLPGPRQPGTGPSPAVRSSTELGAHLDRALTRILRAPSPSARRAP